MDNQLGLFTYEAEDEILRAESSGDLIKASIAIQDYFMKGYSPGTLNTIRQQLEEDKKKIVARIRDLSAQDPYTDPGRLIDNAASDSEANEEASHDRFRAFISELEVQLLSIDEALIRVSSGIYGSCTNCQKMIDSDRLMILPTATLCLQCEQKKKKIRS